VAAEGLSPLGKKYEGLAAVRRCYAEGGGDLRQVVVVGVT